MRKMKQMEFSWPLGHGGARKGAGRQRKGTRARVPHGTRVAFHRPRVLHITCRICEGLRTLRDPQTVVLLMNYLARVCEKEGFRLVEFSIQSNHIHMICEADDHETLAKAMNGLLSGLARKLNRHWGRKGKVFEDRYHSEIIETPTQCRNALIYVLHNAKKHGAQDPRSGADPYSTAPWFPFSSSPNQRKDNKPAAAPATWLLRQGYLRKGPIHLHDHPRGPIQRPTHRRKQAAPKPSQKQAAE